MRMLYLESVGGASGDMLLGALKGCGLDWDAFRRPLEDAVPGLAICTERQCRRGLMVDRLWADFPEEQPHRHLSDVLAIVDSVDIPEVVRQAARKAFERLAAVEAACHGTSPENVHFHEVGAVDSLMDVIGFFWALHLLEVDVVVASPLRLGWGDVETSHGLLPVPVPAVVGLVGDVPVEAGPGPGELTTPTGALLVTEVAQRFSTLPAMRVHHVGCGAGSREGVGGLNILRAWLGEADDSAYVAEAGEGHREPVIVFECNVDDATPEQLAYLRERLEDLGAFDVSIFGGVGKKSRPVHLIRVVADPSDKAAIIDAVMVHSSTLGLRWETMDRLCLARETVMVEAFGESIRVKLAHWKGRRVRCEPEYEDCARAARATGCSLAEVQYGARRCVEDLD